MRNCEILNKKTLSQSIEETDYQGIPWVTLTSRTRSSYRIFRNSQYKPYLSASESGSHLINYPHKNKLSDEDQLFKFKNFYKGIVPNIGHFQLRYNLEAASYHDVYFLSYHNVTHYCTIRNTLRKFLLPYEVNPVCFSMKDNFFCVGDMGGKIVLYNISKNSAVYNGNFLENQEKHIMNSVKLCNTPQGLRMITASNDAIIRVLEIDNFYNPTLLINCINPINYASFSPDCSLLGTYADQKEAELYDAKTGKLVMVLNEHVDYGFCLDWHPNGFHVATGNQDTTCRIWDIRNPKKSVHILQSEIGSIYTTKYSPDGRFLAFGEAIDFVSLYDCHKEYDCYQLIDFFGETAGIDFSPDDSEMLFIGVNIKDFDGILEFKKKKETKKFKDILDSFL